MRTTLALTLLLAAAASAQAQLTTNIEWRVRIAVTGTGGPTSTNTTTMTTSGDNTKEKARNDALYWQYQKQVKGGETNSWDAWSAKTWIKDNLQDVVTAKGESDNRKLAEDVASVLNKNPEDITTSEFATLNTVAAKKQ